MALSILTLHFLHFHVTRILTPLTTISKGFSVCTVSTISIDMCQAPVFWSFDRSRFADERRSGGLKGNKAPGDAHPYLAPF